MGETYQRKFSDVYIIGQRSNIITIQQRRKYLGAQLQLSNRGFNVHNPLENFDPELHPNEEVWRLGLQKLITCGSVYILNDVCFVKGQNVELKIAMDLNLSMIQQPPMLIYGDTKALTLHNESNCEEFFFHAELNRIN